MKGRCPCCGAETDSSKAKFCSECGTKIQQLQQNAESITCNGDDDGKPCMETIWLGKKFCPNCGRQVDPNEFLLGNCQKCGENCLASSKLCTQCLQTVTSETSARKQLGKFGTKHIQTLTRSFSSFPSCERCGKKQLAHWSFCLHCGEKHRNKPRDPGAFGTEERASLETGDDRGDTEVSKETQSQKDVDGQFKKDMTYDWGSDEVDAHISVDSAEAAAFKNVLDQCGYSELMKLIEKNSENKIEIAVAGVSGSGKSSLINALRGLGDNEYGAAQTGFVETTMERKAYPHPDIQNFVLWDLPGFGTDNFPRETYLENVHFEDYDFIIMVSGLRITKNDTWLARKITKYFPNQNLIFVRTKIDVDLTNMQGCRRNSMSDEETNDVLFNIKRRCYDNLIDAGIMNPCVFIVNSRDASQFELAKLTKILVDKVFTLKKDALFMNIQGFTKEISAAKCRLCIQRMEDITKQAAVAAVKSNRKNGERLEVDILKQEVMYYTQQLGIDTNSLDIVARRFRINRNEMIMKLNLETHMILHNFDKFYFKHDKVDPSNGYFLPFLGQFFQLQSFQKQCLSVLQFVLEKCKEENNTLQKNIAVWSLIPNSLNTESL